MARLWKWLGDETNARAAGVLFIAVPAAIAASTYVYSTLWPTPEDEVVIDATQFWRTVNVNVGTYQGCPHKLIHNQPPYEATPLNAAEYRVKLSTGGKYQLLIEYAADDPRPVDIEVNGNVVFRGALEKLSKSWCLARWENIGEITLDRGPNIIRISRPNVFPHLKSLKLVRV